MPARVRSSGRNGRAFITEERLNQVDLFSALMASPAEQERVVLQQFEPWSNPLENQPLLFIKPEVTELGERSFGALTLIDETLKEWGCLLDGIFLLGPEYLQRHRLIERHYGLINTYSSEGLAALPESGRSAAISWAADRGIKAASIFGAHEFLMQNPQFVATDLLNWHEEGTHSARLSAGAFIVFMDSGFGKFGIINGFHPAQIEHFYSAQAPIIVTTLRTRSNWRGLRKELIGATDPSKASAGSLRAQLLARSREFGLESIDSLRNGVHLSGGPVEAVQEIRRYLQDYDEDTQSYNVKQTNLGELITKELGQERAEALISNREIRINDTQGTIFDLTEELNTDQALDLLARSHLV